MICFGHVFETYPRAWTFLKVASLRFPYWFTWPFGAAHATAVSYQVRPSSLMAQVAKHIARERQTNLLQLTRAVYVQLVSTSHVVLPSDNATLKVE